MDHMMPEMDGLETVKRIRVLDGTWYRKMPIIALSANAIQGMRERFLDAGMNDFISKPIDGAQLNRVLGDWLPTDKQTINAPETTVAAEPEYDTALENLKPIKELNVAKGLSYIGNNKDAYLKTLHTFCNILDSSVAEIRNALSEENWQEYRIKVHALKGTFASIGVENLSQRARSLEAAAKSGDYAVCWSETEGFCADMVLFRDELVRFLPVPGHTSVKRQGDKQSLLRLLTLFREYGDKAMKGVIGMSDKLDALAAEAETMQFDEASNIGVQEICQAALAFDYATMLKKTDALIRHRGAESE
jgi:CheY-like chemotaxis protein